MLCQDKKQMLRHSKLLTQRDKPRYLHKLCSKATLGSSHTKFWHGLRKLRGSFRPASSAAERAAGESPRDAHPLKGSLPWRCAFGSINPGHTPSWLGRHRPFSVLMLGIDHLHRLHSTEPVCMGPSSSMHPPHAPEQCKLPEIMVACTSSFAPTACKSFRGRLVALLYISSYGPSPAYSKPKSLLLFSPTFEGNFFAMELPGGQAYLAPI